MEVGSQLHVPALLPPGNTPPILLECQSRWTPEPVWMRWIALPFLGYPTLRLLILPKALFRLQAQVKVKLTLEQATKAQIGSRGIALLFL